MAEIVSATDFAEREGFEDWRYLVGAIEANFHAGSFDGAARFALRIAEAAEEARHHPDLDIRYPDVVHVVLISHSAGGVTEKDLDLAAVISAMAAEEGLAAEPLTSRLAEVGIDAMDIDAVRPFWKAVLGYVDAPGTPPGEQVVDIVDPRRMGPTFWFQQMDEPRTERNRLHIDVTVPHDIAEERVQAALDAGGTLVTAEYARSWWVLADPEGNEACVSTWQDRD